MSWFQGLTREQFRALNSATQYPSIKTYHAIGGRGLLTDERNVDFGDSPVEVTEKIDGVNARVILAPSGMSYIIGSRTEFLTHSGDVVYNPAEGIVETLLATEDWRVVPILLSAPHDIRVIYGEVYGACVSTPGRKQYTSHKLSGFRIFDVATVPVAVLGLPIERVAAWRDSGGQVFEDSSTREQTVEKVPWWTQVPQLYPGLDRFPTTIEYTYGWLRDTISLSEAVLDIDALGMPEGVVVRTPNRSKIAKIRFEDYERTLMLGRFARGGKKRG